MSDRAPDKVYVVDDRMGPDSYMRATEKPEYMSGYPAPEVKNLIVEYTRSDLVADKLRGYEENSAEMNQHFLDQNIKIETLTTQLAEMKAEQDALGEQVYDLQGQIFDLDTQLMDALEGEE